ncbi:MAG: hypothetical protein EBZ77_00950 [Chitinophagia bacterium]|nr:hypothetical protein [Chitinophagia bacterium]
MKKIIIKTVLPVAAFALLFAACKKKDDAQPVEQELITTLKFALTDTAGHTDTFVYRIENGFGSTSQGTVRIDTVKLRPLAHYASACLLLNEKATPAENTTEEILTERNVHLFLYQSTPATGAGSVSFTGGSRDFNNLPFNQTGTIVAGAAGSGTLVINLMHEPTDKNGTTPATSGGETDAEVQFPVVIQ